MSGIRSSPTFQALADVCHEYGVTFDVERGGKHPFLALDIAGVKRKYTFPNSPSDHRSATNSAAQLRRLIEQVLNAQSPGGMPSSPTTEIGLHVVEDEPRALDTDIGERLGMARPTNIRGVIEASREELERFGPLHTARAMVDIGSGAKRETTAYYLNEEQSLLVSIKSTAPRAAEVRHMLIKVFTAWRRGQGAPLAGIDMHRIAGMLKSAVREITVIREEARARDAIIEDTRAAADLAMEAARKAEERLASAAVAPTFDLAASMTSDQIIEAAHIAKADRQRGTAQLVTNRMLEFCTARGAPVRRTPIDLNPSRPWRFPREMAAEWLFGASMGAELIRNQIAARKAAKARKGRSSGQVPLRLVPTLREGVPA
jgi:hypothetical protein